uniref:hypothetical protein n=1 Tax=Alloprevotella sp. TaxID=1872471 RepID=UPI004028E86A
MKQIFLQLFFIFLLKNMFFLFFVVGCYINKLQFVEELRTNASSPGGDASPRRHCQLRARCPKLAIL